uniref:NmrA-like domain-containing protein n=1 Tax=Leersia perrieri TaxID=77586 RepID=A0A0D9XYC1_9ORYZ
MEEKKSSRVLVVGATGFVGRRIVAASLAEGHPTYVLMRPELGLAVDKVQTLLVFKARGARLLEASLDDHRSLVAAVRQVDVVVSAMSGGDLLQQLKLVEAIKDAGNVKRFIPSEFGLDPAMMGHATESGRIVFDQKMIIRRAIEDANIPHTYVSASLFAFYFVANLGQMRTLIPPKEKVLIYGDGNTKAIFVDEDDAGTYTIKSIEDPRALNKTLHIRPKENFLTQNEVIAKWENLSGKVLEKISITGDEFLASREGTDYFNQAAVGHFYDIFYKGCLTNFEIGENGVEATLLYPEVKLRSKHYKTCDRCVDGFDHHCREKKSSRVLVVGATGFVGRRIVAVSLVEGHPTYVLMRRELGLAVDKVQNLLAFKARGARLLEASLDDHRSLVAAVRQVDVVVSAMAGSDLLQQLKLVEAIKDAGNIEVNYFRVRFFNSQRRFLVPRFIPSEFGMDPAMMEHATEPGRIPFDQKMIIRRAIEDANIPHTYVSASLFAFKFVANLGQMRTLIPPKEKVLIYGDGNTKDEIVASLSLDHLFLSYIAIFVDEDDTGTYTIKSIDDPRALNRRKVLEKISITGDEFLASREGTDDFNQMAVGHFYDIFYKGCLTNFEIGENGVEATLLYPEVHYSRMDEYLKRYLN